jgi:hypothetical protein
VLLRLPYLALSSMFTLLRLLPMSDRDKDIEILALRHQLAILQPQIDKPRLTTTDRAFLAALLHRLPRIRLRRLQLADTPGLDGIHPRRRAPLHPDQQAVGQPGRNLSPPFPRICTITRSSAYSASGRACGVTSIANISGWPGRAGQDKPSSRRRSAPASIRPPASASYTDPCPGRNSGSSDNSTGERTGPWAHSIASVSSNSASARRQHSAWNRVRNMVRFATADLPDVATAPATGFPGAIVNI